MPSDLPENAPSSSTGTDLARRVGLLTMAVVILSLILAAVLVFLVAPTVVGLVLPSSPKSTPVCTGFPLPGVNYYVNYNLTTGGVEGGVGTTDGPPVSETVNGHPVGDLNITGQPVLVHSAFCWFAVGNSGPPPWQVDLATDRIIAIPQPPPPIPTYLWLDPVLGLSFGGGFPTWRFLTKRGRRHPPAET